MREGRGRMTVNRRKGGKLTGLKVEKFTGRMAINY